MVTTQLEKGWMISSVNSIERRAGIIKRYRLGNSEIDFLVDTGSDVNTLPLWIYKRVTNDSNLQNLKQATQRVNCYNNSSVTCLGSIDLQVTDDSASHLLTFLVLDQKVDPLIGVQSTLELNLLTSASISLLIFLQSSMLNADYNNRYLRSDHFIMLVENIENLTIPNIAFSMTQTKIIFFHWTA